MTDIITGTPPDLTYGHWLVQEAWLVVWAVTSAALVVILGSWERNRRSEGPLAEPGG